MKTLTVRMPDALAAEIEATARRLGQSKSTIVRERLRAAQGARGTPPSDIADVIGAVDGLPADLSRRVKPYLRSTGYGRKRHR